MKKLILFLHLSLDGFAAGPNGEMDWIIVNDEIFDYVGTLTAEADTGLYGRKTFEMMENYWPTAADQPNASKHDIEHAQWYSKVDKIVISKTLAQKDQGNTKVISTNIPDEIRKIKQGNGKNIIVFGSPSTAQLLIQHNLADEYWLFINPVALGKGIALFNGIEDRIKLRLLTAKIFSSGVTAHHYSAGDV
jgi:dihydrofolate reductase